MNNNQLMLRHAILLQVEASYPGALPMETIFQGVKLAGLKVDRDVLNKEIHYLMERDMLVSKRNTISPASERYRLTANGRDYLDTQGLSLIN